jgi:hypothetical protein
VSLKKANTPMQALTVCCLSSKVVRKEKQSQVFLWFSANTQLCSLSCSLCGLAVVSRLSEFEICGVPFCQTATNGAGHSSTCGGGSASWGGGKEMSIPSSQAT